MMKHLRTFENYKDEAEYIFTTNANWVGSDYEEPLEGFTDEDYEDFKRGGTTYNDMRDKAIEYFGLSWELDEENGTLMTSTQFMGTEEEVDSEGYGETDYEELEELAMMAQGIEFDVVPNKEHPLYEPKQQSKKYNI